MLGLVLFLPPSSRFAAGLVDTETLIKGLRSGVIRQAGLDVYENEAPYFFKDCSNTPVQVRNVLPPLDVFACRFDVDAARPSLSSTKHIYLYVSNATRRNQCYYSARAR